MAKGTGRIKTQMMWVAIFLFSFKRKPLWRFRSVTFVASTGLHAATSIAYSVHLYGSCLMLDGLLSRCKGQGVKHAQCCRR